MSTKRLHTIIHEKGDLKIVEVPAMDEELVSFFWKFFGYRTARIEI